MQMVITLESNCLTERNTLYLIINKNNKIKVMSTKKTTTAKRGRPTVAGSKRQAVLAMRAAKVAAGGEIKRGRPAGTKKVAEVTIEVKAVAKKAKAVKSIDSLVNSIVNEA